MRTTRFLFFGTLLLVAVSILSSCQHCVDGQGATRKAQRTLNAFDAVDVTLPAEVTIKVGDTNLMLIQTQSNIIPLIKSDVRRGTLHLTASCYHVTKPVRITLTVKSLKKISLTGSGKIRVPDMLSPDKLSLSLSGSGQIEADVLSTKVDAEVDGSGLLIVNGKAKEFDPEVNGSGVIRALGLRVKKAYAEVNGSGQIYVSAKDYLKATISGTGIIHYTGSPEVRSKINGSGKVDKVD